MTQAPPQPGGAPLQHAALRNGVPLGCPASQQPRKMAQNYFRECTLRGSEEMSPCDSFHEAINRQAMRGTGDRNFIQCQAPALFIPLFKKREPKRGLVLPRFQGSGKQVAHLLLPSRVKGKSTARSTKTLAVLSDHRPHLC